MSRVYELAVVLGIESGRSQVLSCSGMYTWIYLAYCSFATDVRPDHLRGQLGDKYKGFTAEELKDRPDFLDDLLR